jgi:hypothetical protein
MARVCGWFDMAIGAALYERSMPSTTVSSRQPFGLCPADRLEIPELEILHHETSVASDPLGAEAVAARNSITPLCIADTVADALGVAKVSVPLTSERVLELVRRRGQ